MDYQSVFKRYEIKFLLSRLQKDKIRDKLSEYMCEDKHGKTTVRNLYYDTENFLLIRRSIEKPIYKEKLRLRSYGKVSKDDCVFVELKKKYNGIVYKRRLAMPENKAMMWLNGDDYPFEKCQISNEIDYFKGYYRGLEPKVFLSYDREAFFDKGKSDLRITFDENIISRREELSLCSKVWGKALIEEDLILMELKTAGGIPLWLTHLLTDMNLFKTSFSKYGNVYTSTILNKTKEGIIYA